MDIKNLSDLAKIATLCRKKGIETIKITPDSVEFKLKDAPIKMRKLSRSENENVSVEDQQALTAEDKLFWSAPGFNAGAEG